MQRDKRSASLCAVLAMLALIAACSGAETADPEEADDTADAGTSAGQADARDGESVVVAIGSDVSNPDLAKYGNLDDISIVLNMFDTLTYRGRDGQGEPMIATDWETSDDGLEWTIQIRDDVVFHNGEPMTAEDVAFSVLRLADPEFGYASTQYWAMVEDAVAIDEHTVQFILSEPNPLLMHQGSRLPIVPKDYVEEVGEEEYTAAPVASGPYRFVEWLPDDRLVLEAHEEYWQGTPAIRNVTFRPMPEEASRTAALRSGEVDIAIPVGIEQLEQIEADPGLKVLETQGLERMRITLDTNYDELANRDVRQAINHAIDVDTIISEILEGYAERIPAMLVPLEPGYNPDLEPYEYDPELARELLATAGYPDGLDTAMVIRQGFPKVEEVGQAIAGYLSEVGINVDLTLTTSADFASQSTDKTLPPMHLTIWGGGGQFHGTHFYNIAMRCEGASPVHGGYYCNPEIDERIDEAIQIWTDDQDRAIELIQEAEELFYEDAGHGFLYINSRLYGMKSGLDWEPHPDGSLWMLDASWS